MHIILNRCFGRYLFLFSVYFFSFIFFTRTGFILLFNHYANLGKYVHIFRRTNHARNTTAVPSPC